MKKGSSIIAILLCLNCYGQKDKLYHLGAGFTITYTFGMITKKPVIGFYLGNISGIGKEVIDYKTHKSEIGDIYATSFGTLLAYLIIQEKFKKVILNHKKRLDLIPVGQKECSTVFL